MQQKRSRRQRPVIRASEVGNYVYCRRAWWLKRIAGYEMRGRERELTAGITAHTRHGKAVRGNQTQRRLALALFGIGLLLLALAAFSLLV